MKAFDVSRVWSTGNAVVMLAKKPRKIEKNFMLMFTLIRLDCTITCTEFVSHPYRATIRCATIYFVLGLVTATRQ